MSTPSKDDLYRELKSRILTMDLAPGTGLDETRISKKFGMSRTPLRDVFRQLAGEGYLNIVGNRGASVSSMNHKVIMDFFQAAPMIYASISRLAAQNATEAQIREIKEIQRRFRRAAAKLDVQNLILENNEFHAKLGEIAGNQYLLPTLNRLLIDHSRIAQTFYQRKNVEKGDRLRVAVEQHDQIIAAIEAGDEETAVAVTLAHWELSRSEAEIFVRPDPLPFDAND